MKKITVLSSKELIEIASNIGKKCAGNELFLLHGELGSGKTTFVKGLAMGLNIPPKKVTSPTFTYLNIYEGKYVLYHFDLYKIFSPDDLEGLGFYDFLNTGIICVEWPEKINKWNENHLLINIFYGIRETERIIEFKSENFKNEEILNYIKGLK